jgi:hypothetical protein
MLSKRTPPCDDATSGTLFPFMAVALDAKLMEKPRGFTMASDVPERQDVVHKASSLTCSLPYS